MSDLVLHEQDGGVVTLTLNQPERRNPISEAGMVEALVAAVERLSADSSVRAAILTGAGRAFSSGGDLRAMSQAAEARASAPAGTVAYYTRGIQRITLAFARLDVPVIAAVNGPAIGAGLDLACMCDIRIAAEGATFAESFVKLGIVPGDGGGAGLRPGVARGARRRAAAGGARAGRAHRRQPGPRRAYGQAPAAAGP